MKKQMMMLLLVLGGSAAPAQASEYIQLEPGIFFWHRGFYEMICAPQEEQRRIEREKEASLRKTQEAQFFKRRITAGLAARKKEEREQGPLQQGCCKDCAERNDTDCEGCAKK